MSAPQGGSTPNAFVFPPFAPPTPRTAPAAPRPFPAPVEEVAMEVPLPAHDVGAPDTDLPLTAAPEEAQPWEAASHPAEDDLPWLEMPAGGARVHVTETPAADDEMAGWAGWGLNDAPARETEITPPVPEPGADFAPAAGFGSESNTGFAPIADFSPESATDIAPAADFPPAADFAPPAEEPTPSWEAMFAPADDFAAAPAVAEPAPADDSPAEQALLAEVEPAFELPAAVASPVVEPEAALELEAAGFSSNVATPEPDFLATAFAPEPPAPVAASGLDDVADRLESIARALRTDPDAFLAGHTGDPLGLLVTGFVLGYRQRPGA